MVKVKIKELSNVWIKLKNHHGNTIYQENYFIFEISCTFKVVTKNIS
jgi:hypothetical protein